MWAELRTSSENLTQIPTFLLHHSKLNLASVTSLCLSVPKLPGILRSYYEWELIARAHKRVRVKWTQCTGSHTHIHIRCEARGNPPLATVIIFLLQHEEVLLCRTIHYLSFNLHPFLPLILAHFLEPLSTDLARLIVFSSPLPLSVLRILLPVPQLLSTLHLHLSLPSSLVLLCTPFPLFPFHFCFFLCVCMTSFHG